MIRIRQPHVVRVGGTDLGDSYRDDNGHLWWYERRAALPFGEIRAFTDAYGGAQTEWTARSPLGLKDHDDTNASIEMKAAILGVAEKVGEVVSETPPSGGKSTPKSSASSFKTYATEEEGVEEQSASARVASSSSNSVLLIFLGMIGAGLVVWKLVA
jgi:hypothetical protein